MSRDHSQNHYGPNASFDGHDSDLAAAGILIESLRQQLAAALAACKLKHSALETLWIGTNREEWDGVAIKSFEDAIAIQPDDSALKAWIGEPVGEVKKHTGSLKDMAIIVWTGKQPEEGTKLYAPKGLK